MADREITLMMAALAIASLPFINTTSCSAMALVLHLFLINRNAPIRTYDTATGAANAVVWSSSLHVRITVDVHLFLSQRDNILRASHYAQLASLASICVNDNGTFKFSHRYKI